MEYELGKKVSVREDWEEFCKFLTANCLSEEKVEYTVEEKKVHNRNDKGYKYLLSIKRNFIDFIKTFTNITWEEEITEKNITLMDKEFITVDFDKKESDLIYEVKIKNQKAYFILLEIQSKVERKMAYRLLNYIVEIWRKWEKGLNANKGEKFILPKIIPCVIYTGKEKWTAPVEFRDLYNSKEKEEYLINFKYILIDIYRYKPENLLEIGNVISSAFYLDTSTKEDIGNRLIELTKSLANAEKEMIEEFKRWIINMFILDEEKQKIIEEKFVKEENEMGNLAKIGKEIYEDGVRAGEEKGLKAGIKEGEKQGIEKGRISSVIKILKKKLKEENKEVEVLIEKACNEKIDEIEDKIFEITSWKDVKDILG